VIAQLGNLFHKEVERYTAEGVRASVTKFKSGALASVVATNTAIPGRWITDWHLVGKNATVYFSGANDAEIIRTNDPWLPQEKPSSQKDIYNTETLDFVNAVKNNSSTRAPITEGPKSLELVPAARTPGEDKMMITL